MSDQNLEPHKKQSYSELLSSDPLISVIQTKLSKAFRPEKMFLFGSRAYGTQRPDSDYDFLLVVENPEGNRFENMDKARKILSELNVSADVFVYSRQEFEDWKNELNTVAEAAHNLGVEIPLGLHSSSRRDQNLKRRIWRV